MTHVGIVCNARRSLFCYQPDESFETFFDPFFIPIFEPTFSTPELEQEADEVCGEDRCCRFDIAVTGDRQVGEATINSTRDIEIRLDTVDPGKFHRINDFNCFILFIHNS